MTASRTTEIADKIVERLNEEIYELSITAKRWTLPDYKLTDLEEVQVAVVPIGRQTVVQTRHSIDQTHKIEIGIMKHVDDINDAEEVDPIGLLVEQIESTFLGKIIDGATCIELNSILSDDSLYSKEHLEYQKVYTSVLVLTYQE